MKQKYLVLLAFFSFVFIGMFQEQKSPKKENIIPGFDTKTIEEWKSAHPVWAYSWDSLRGNQKYKVIKESSKEDKPKIKNKSNKKERHVILQGYLEKIEFKTEKAKRIVEGIWFKGFDEEIWKKTGEMPKWESWYFEPEDISVIRITDKERLYLSCEMLLKDNKVCLEEIKRLKEINLQLQQKVKDLIKC